MSLRKLLFTGAGAIIGAKIGKSIGKSHQERMSKMSAEELELYKAKQKKTWKTAGTLFKWYFIFMLLFLIISLIAAALNG